MTISPVYGILSSGMRQERRSPMNRFNRVVLWVVVLVTLILPFLVKH